MDAPKKRLFERANQNQEIAKRRNALSDLVQAFSGTAVVRLWMAILAFLRKFRMLRILLRIAGWLITVLQAGTLIVLTTAVFFVLLPILGILLVIVPPLALLDRRKSKKRLSEVLSDSCEVVFVFQSGTVIAQSAAELSETGHRTIIIISPYWISGRRTDGTPAHYYINLRQESDRVFLVRRYFYFCVRKMAKNNPTVFVY